MVSKTSFIFFNVLHFLVYISSAQGSYRADSLVEKSSYDQGNISTSINSVYPFTLIDYSDKLYTMRQFNEGYLSLYRLTSDAVYKHTPKKYQYLILPVQMLASFYFIPLTHEEGHRSVLTNLSIGSVSDPLFKRGVAKVVGVTDQTLQQLRDTNLPEYIRLHTAGLESDYMLTKREQQSIAFGHEKLKNVIGDFYPRRLGIAFYFISSAFSTKNPIEAEENNELDRDIVGDDIRGGVRHLHRPNAPFYRYTNYADLLPDERKYIRRAGFWSLLNIASPLLFGKSAFTLTKDANMSFGLGYILAPFGTMAEENIWISYRNNTNISLCVRQYSNQHNTFWGAELSLFDKLIGRHCAISGSVQGWKQPQDLSFTIDKGTLGGAAMLRLGYRMYGRANSPFQWLSVDGNIRVKTDGFVPEDPSLKQATNLAFGFSVCPN